MFKNLNDDFENSFGKYLVKTLAASTVSSAGILLGMVVAGYTYDAVKKFKKNKNNTETPTQ